MSDNPHDLLLDAMRSVVDAVRARNAMVKQGQQVAHRDEIEADHTVVMQLPRGCGKSVAAARLASELVDANRNDVFVVVDTPHAKRRMQGMISEMGPVPPVLVASEMSRVGSWRGLRPRTVICDALNPLIPDYLSGMLYEMSLALPSSELVVLNVGM
ncbi:MAG: hypothetical protein AAGD32_13800 [Planctomycetota bacterium]